VKQHNRPTAAALAAALLALAAVPAGADWLVTREGGRVETKGSWQTKGKLVVFTLPNGKLSSLRLSEVDLDASRRATAEAAAAAEAAPAAPAEAPKQREAKVVLTDASFKRTTPPAPPAAPGDEAKKDGEAPPDANKNKLAIASWERLVAPGNGSVVIAGEVRNDAPDQATGVTVTVLLYDETGKLLVSGDAVLTSTIIPAGQTASFRAEFPDVFTFAAAKFDARGMMVLRKAGEPAKSGE
jgi:hypothetical protein